MPTDAWGDNYVLVQPGAGTPSADPASIFVAARDNTTLTIVPSATIVGGTDVITAPVGTPTLYTLQRGDVLQFSQPAELSGSVVQADGPIAAFGAHGCFRFDDDVGCDPVQQQLPPVPSLGQTHVAAPHPARDISETQFRWRLNGVADGTFLAYEPNVPAGAPTQLSLGQVADFVATGPFVVTSQDAAHPVILSAFMVGGSHFNGAGDPEWVLVPPTDQFQTVSTFVVDSDFSESAVTVTRRRDDASGLFHDVTLDCSGLLSGWTPVGDVEVTEAHLITGDFTPLNGCTSGVHTLTSPAPFAATLWSFGSSLVRPNSSTATPTGASWRRITDIVVPVTPR